MSCNNKDLSRLSKRDEELVALGAAIASNCVPCVEYHIPQARKTGLSDSEIRAAVELADKVRRVPADKVLQTAFALLERPNPTQTDSERNACGCSDEAKSPRERTAGEPVDPPVNDVRLDNGSTKEDNAERKERCGEDTKDPFRARRFDEEAGSRSRTFRTGFDFSKMMEMMQRCCPDKMKGFSSMMSELEEECSSPNESPGSKEPV